MKRTLRATLTVLTALLISGSVGCNWVFVSVQVPDFDSAAVDGLWMHVNDGNGFVPVNQVEFLETEIVNGVEVVSFRFHDGAHGSEYDWKTMIERDPTNDDGAMVRIAFARPTSGTYKVSTYNVVGESELSAESLDL